MFTYSPVWAVQWVRGLHSCSSCNSDSCFHEPMLLPARTWSTKILHHAETCVRSFYLHVLIRYFITQVSLFLKKARGSWLKFSSSTSFQHLILVQLTVLLSSKNIKCNERNVRAAILLFSYTDYLRWRRWRLLIQDIMASKASEEDSKWHHFIPGVKNVTFFFQLFLDPFF